MKRSTRFPSAVHILTILAAQPDGYTSSELIASSLGTNRVVVLRLIGMLREAGLVSSQTGALGGACLAKKPREISLLDVYRAVEQEGSIFRMHTPHTDCPVGKRVTKDLAGILDEAESLLEKKLASKSLARTMKNGIQEMERFMERYER